MALHIVEDMDVSNFLRAAQNGDTLSFIEPTKDQIQDILRAMQGTIISHARGSLNNWLTSIANFTFPSTHERYYYNTGDIVLVIKDTTSIVFKTVAHTDKWYEDGAIRFILIQPSWEVAGIPTI